MAKKTPKETEPQSSQPVPKQGREPYNWLEVERLHKSWYETRYNIVKGVVEFRHANTREEFIRLEDTDLNSMVRKLQNVKQNIPFGILRLLLYSDFSPKYHPFKEYFKQLPVWDGVTDWIGQLAATLKTTEEEFWNRCFKKWFVAFALSMLVDKIINHTAIVLVGGQGGGKSSWMPRLMPEALKDYSASSISQSDSKDAAIQLAECGLIIMDDMEGLDRKDLNAFKEMITRPNVHVRRPYAHISEILARIASFIVSLNYSNLLTDPTGSRRFLCFNVVSVDPQHTVSIDLCMAQAVALQKENFTFYFTQEEMRELEEHNENFKAKSIEEELIDTWLRKVTQQEWADKDKFMKDKNIQLMNAAKIAAILMEKARFVLSDKSLSKIGKVMSANGFLRVQKNKKWVYMVRVLDQATVDEDSRILNDPEAEQKNNDKIIRLEEDLSGGPVDDLPF